MVFYTIFLWLFLIIFSSYKFYTPQFHWNKSRKLRIHSILSQGWPCSLDKSHTFFCMLLCFDVFSVFGLLNIFIDSPRSGVSSFSLTALLPHVIARNGFQLFEMSWTAIYSECICKRFCPCQRFSKKCRVEPRNNIHMSFWIWTKHTSPWF